MKNKLILIFTVAALSTLVTSKGWAQKKEDDSSVGLKWLHEYTPDKPTGVSWGVPWPQGHVKKNQQFVLTSEDGQPFPLQAWDLAYWPDGSVKWSGFATVVEQSQSEFTLTPAKKADKQEQPELTVKETSQYFKVNSGPLQCIIPKSGSYFLDSITIEGRLLGGNSHLEMILQSEADGEAYNSPKREKYISEINKVSLEQEGAVRTVFRVEGKVRSENGQRELLPFNLRLYFYAGSQSIRLVNTIIYDGDQHEDFIKGLGMVFSVPLREEVHNRHVRFSGEEPGIWAEPVRPLVGRRAFLLNSKNVYPDQVKGKPIANQDAFDDKVKNLITELPVWNDYKLVQSNADGFTIQKRTNPRSTWLDANAGKRATGLAFVGDVKGGLAVGLKDFWQSYPAALEIRGAAKDMAEMKVWLWSPYNDAMDMRHYDTIAHGLEATYEDVQEGLSTPYGIGRTSELTLFAHAEVPSNELLSNQARISSQTPLLVASPEYYNRSDAFGIWSLPDRSTPGKAWIEDQLDLAIDFYKNQIDQRNWYGFWNYGDIMHDYDTVRHSWKYDIGGYAWDNTELASDFWLWYSFLRSGRADIFTMAEAMSRHTSEVDVYHIGELAGLGSRHNVRHWGDGSKETRESQAASRRFYYYLTTDERTGDIMREVAEQAGIAMANLDPLRMIFPKMQYPTHARFGPDWLSLVGNWMTEWERTGDNKWRDKILAGINSLDKMPYGFYTGNLGALGYDPASDKLYMLDKNPGYSHLSVLMGGPEVVFELKELLQNKKFDRMWMQFCKLWGMQPEDVEKEIGQQASLGVVGVWYARMPAYVAYKQKEQQYAKKAWDWFLDDKTKAQFDDVQVTGVQALKTLREIPGMSTNQAAQWSLNAIQLLELVGNEMPHESPLWDASKETGRKAE